MSATEPARTSPQNSSRLFVGDDQGFQRVDAALAGDEAASSAAVGREPADPDLGDVHECGLAGGAEVGDDIGESAKPLATVDPAAAAGEQRSDLGDCPADRGTVHLEPSSQYVVRHSEPQVNEGWPGADRRRPACTSRSHRQPAVAVGRVARHLCGPARHTGPNSAITDADKPVTRRTDMISLRASVPTTNSPTTQPNHRHANHARTR